MGKARLTLSAHRKKRKLNPALVQYNEKRRKTKDSGDHEEKLVNSESEENGLAKDDFYLQGRRVVNISEFLQEIQKLDNHSPFDCSFKNMKAVREKRSGLRSGFVFRCEMCNTVQTIWSESVKDNEMDINTAAVSGTMTTGGGHAQLEEMLSIMNIPPMSNKTYSKYENDVSKGWMTTAELAMKEAAEEEARLAREQGDVDKDGTPLITVVADGSWCKRSYRTNYSSLSGVAAVVGYKTRKVLSIGVKNKYCTPCARAEALGEPAKDHTCFKNWGKTQSSTSMEAAIICEAFQRSEEVQGIRYARLIADGDSSVYKKILERRPYKHLTVEKIECKNHLLRNTCNRLKALTTTRTAKGSIHLRKKIGENIMRCRTAVAKAKDHRKFEERPIQEKIEELRKDILNIPSHVFGEHRGCTERGYFCQLQPSTAPQQSNLVPSMVAAGLYIHVYEVFKDLSRHSRSLLTDVTSNYVEHFNSIIAKFIGGKRVNFAMRGSYRGRCAAAVVQHNSGKAHYSLHKVLYKSSPGMFIKNTENKRKRKCEAQKSKKKCKKFLFSLTSGHDQDYGLSAQRPDVDDDTMAKESAEFLKTLEKTEQEILRIEKNTVDQSENSEWLEVRRNLLTASNFGRVCKMRPQTSCQSLVKQMLYSVFDCDSMAYGRQHEDTARQEVANHLGVSIDKCGIFIDREHHFLGASPDGLIGDNAIVEIKCPSSARDMTPEEAIVKRKVTFWTVTKSKEIGDIQKKHNFYFQVQGQLHVSKRSTCFFSLWTPKGLKIETIYKDDSFWEKEMFPKLKQFYKNCILPELVDPRQSRNMPIRDPPYILEAQQKAQEKMKK